MNPIRLLAALAAAACLSACSWLAPEPAVSEVQVYPRPFNGTVRISFRLDRSADVALRLYASPLPCGWSDPQRYAQRLDAGWHDIQIGCSDFPRGLYEADLLVDGAPYRLQLLSN
ncbi:MAG: hypothetical protein NW241_10265 [Bacteroidia bacterium]|nr:hypothetical protein [Bacteroidia bacterium]